jgi:hypothetical protein
VARGQRAEPVVGQEDGACAAERGRERAREPVIVEVHRRKGHAFAEIRGDLAFELVARQIQRLERQVRKRRGDGAYAMSEEEEELNQVGGSSIRMAISDNVSRGVSRTCRENASEHGTIENPRESENPESGFRRGSRDRRIGYRVQSISPLLILQLPRSLCVLLKHAALDWIELLLQQY